MKKKIKYPMQAFWTNGEHNAPFAVKSVEEFDELRAEAGWEGVGARLIKTESITTVDQEYPAKRPKNY